MRTEVLDIRRAGSTLSVEWEVEVSSTAFGQMSYRGERGCTPNGGAQEPWFATGADGLGLEIVDQNWRWPRTLRPGDQFGGKARVVRVDRAGEEVDTVGWVEREHRVAAREEVDVPAGSFFAWRVAVTERSETAAGTTSWRRTLWVARDVGLVRSVLSTGDGTLRHELIDWGGLGD